MKKYLLFAVVFLFIFSNSLNAVTNYNSWIIKRRHCENGKVKGGYTTCEVITYDYKYGKVENKPNKSDNELLKYNKKGNIVKNYKSGGFYLFKYVFYVHFSRYLPII